MILTYYSDINKGVGNYNRKVKIHNMNNGQSAAKYVNFNIKVQRLKRRIC